MFRTVVDLERNEECTERRLLVGENSKRNLLGGRERLSSRLTAATVWVPATTLSARVLWEIRQVLHENRGAIG